MDSAKPLVLFDIDGTLVRRSGPHHRQALVQAVLDEIGVRTTTEDVPVAGMLDRDILRIMMERAGVSKRTSLRSMPAIMRRAELDYVRTCPNLHRRVCPGVRRLLPRLRERGVIMGLVTGNLSRIGWRKLEQAGLKDYFRFGAFAEFAKDRAGLVKYALRHAKLQKYIQRGCQVSLIGDHPNDVNAARANGIRSIAVATGPATYEELLQLNPDFLLPTLRAFDLDMLS